MLNPDAGAGLRGNAVFDPDCRACPRLSRHLAEVKRQFPAYHARPVPAFGAPRPRLLIVGLAPGLHGANATGRPFTGDYAGILLYRMLYKYGFASRPDSAGPADGLRLSACRITNAVKCLPPQNRPVGPEINRCNSYLAAELKRAQQGAVILCLGQIAHRASIKALGLKQAAYPFRHSALHALDDGRTLVDSYHCSRYNLNTKRLTEAMFEAIFRRISGRLGRRARHGV